MVTIGLSRTHEECDVFVWQLSVRALRVSWLPNDCIGAAIGLCFTISMDGQRCFFLTSWHCSGIDYAAIRRSDGRYGTKTCCYFYYRVCIKVAVYTSRWPYVVVESFNATPGNFDSSTGSLLGPCARALFSCVVPAALFVSRIGGVVIEAARSALSVRPSDLSVPLSPRRVRRFSEL